MQVNIRQMKIKNRPEYLFNDNMIVSIKYFVSSLLKTNKLSFKAVFSLNIYYIEYIPTKSPKRVRIDRTDNDEVFLYLFLDDVDRYIERSSAEQNSGIRYLVFGLTHKNKKALKITKNFGKKLKSKLK